MLTAKNLTRALIASGVALSIMPVESSSAAVFIDRLVDDFESQQVLDVLGEAPDSAFSSVAAPTAIGGNRDLFVEKTFGSAGQGVRGSSNRLGQGFLRQSIDEARGRTVVTWDGADETNNVDYTGLGGVDFSAFTQLDFQVAFSDLGGPVNFTFWDADDASGNTFATTTFDVPGRIPTSSPIILSKDFTDFSTTGGSLSDIFDSIGAIQMEIDARGEFEEGWDSRYGFVRVSGETEKVPEPTTILGTVIFGAGIVAKRKQRKAQNND